MRAKQTAETRPLENREEKEDRMTGMGYSSRIEESGRPVIYDSNEIQSSRGANWGTTQEVHSETAHQFAQTD